MTNVRQRVTPAKRFPRPLYPTGERKRKVSLLPVILVSVSVVLFATVAIVVLPARHSNDERFLHKSLRRPRKAPPVAIFYNVYTAPGKSTLTLRIVEEQLNVWRASNIYSRQTPLFYALLGEEIQMPCKQSETCTQLSNVDSNGFEEQTLQGLHDYCMSHPEHHVLYIHTKGSFHDNAENTMMRQLLTNAAFSSACTSITPEDECDVCSARFSPIPHWHTSGNMWLAKCSHVIKLIPPKTFSHEMNQMVKQARQVFSVWPPPSHPSFVGEERFANEHWVHTHPQVLPCDVYTNEDWTWNYTVALDSSTQFELAAAPRFDRERYGLMEHPGFWMNLGYRLFELQTLYEQVPPEDSWVWDFYQHGLVSDGLLQLKQWNEQVWRIARRMRTIE